MAIRVQATFVFTEDDFENLSFEKKGDIIEKMLSHPDWDTELVAMAMDEANMKDDWRVHLREEEIKESPMRFGVVDV